MALAEPFEIARGVQTESENVVVELTHEGETGVGAAAPSTHYGETAATVEAVLPRLFDVLPGDPHDIDAAHAAMDRAVRDNPAAKAAVDIAMHDLAGSDTTCLCTGISGSTRVRRRPPRSRSDSRRQQRWHGRPRQRATPATTC